MIRPSFVPARPLRALRVLLHHRRTLTEIQTGERNRLRKALDTAEDPHRKARTARLGSPHGLYKTAR
jgi:hypothetical protein